VLRTVTVRHIAISHDTLCTYIGLSITLETQNHSLRRVTVLQAAGDSTARCRADSSEANDESKYNPT